MSWVNPHDTTSENGANLTINRLRAECKRAVAMSVCAVWRTWEGSAASEYVEPPTRSREGGFIACLPGVGRYRLSASSVRSFCVNPFSRTSGEDHVQCGDGGR